jgi:hypothetical protein
MVFRDSVGLALTSKSYIKSVACSMPANGRELSRLATRASRTIRPVSSTTQTAVSSSDTSNPAK